MLALHGVNQMRAIPFIVVALSCAFLASCGGGPPPSDVDTEAYTSAIHNGPRIMISANSESRVVEAEAQFTEWEDQFDALLGKIRAQKVSDAQKAKVRQALDAELASMEASLKRANEPERLTPAQRARINKAYHKLVDKIKDSKIE
jgi:hypothetical protein